MLTKFARTVINSNRIIPAAWFITFVYIVLGMTWAIISNTYFMSPQGLDNSYDYQLILDSTFILLSAIIIYFILTYVKAQLYKQLDTMLKYHDEQSLFLYKLIHDFKNPINAISGLAQLSHRESLNENLEIYISKIEQCANRLNLQLEQMMEFLEVSEGKKGLKEYDIVPIRQLVEEIIQSLKLQYTDVINIQINIPADLTYSTNKLLMYSIMQNIIENAFKYSRFSNNTPIIGIEAIANKEEFQFIVNDNGLGINKADKNRVFEKFFRAEYEEGKYTVKGSGLGLYITKSLVELLCGTIQLHTAEGEGAKFTVSLPIASA
ncbi:MAG: HAMP domain-containing sensor histidine kinase [Bacteroidota bacterium]|nr:HAMP domain-containing sensor histidine kinase [Bacteroidota bacterium]